MSAANHLKISVECPVSTSVRARQVSSMFDVPPSKRCRLEWDFDFPYDAEPWNVGLMVGASGSGKSTILNRVFGAQTLLEWRGKSVIDDVEGEISVEKISAAFSAVGFNTIPAWLRPYSVLSNGEKFRVDLARRILESTGRIVVDEFTSVVDRQVAKLASYAVQKYVRRDSKQLVAASCHYDIIDWLQPDWVFDVSTRSFTRRLLQRRPSIECDIRRVPHDCWQKFAPHHYLTADLHRAAKCFAVFVGGEPVSFSALVHRPISRGNVKYRIWAISRSVTLPDWQGIGFSRCLNDVLAAAIAGVGDRCRVYFAIPVQSRAYDRSPKWRLVSKPRMSPLNIRRDRADDGSVSFSKKMGGRPCAILEYVGERMESAAAAQFMERSR